MTLNELLEQIEIDSKIDHNRLDFEATMATFSHPRYELMGSGVVHDGQAAVQEY